MKNKINGFLILRLPDMNYTPVRQGAYFTLPPNYNGIYYGGIDRMQWFDIDEDIYNHTLPNNIKMLMQSIKKQNQDFSGIELCKDWDTTLSILNYSNRLESKNEIIALYSSTLTSIKGVVEVETPKIIWVGYDVIALGYFSLLREGLFTHPSFFSEWHSLINEYGLLTSTESGNSYAQAYQIAAYKGLVEKIPSHDLYGLELIKIGKVNLQ